MMRHHWLSLKLIPREYLAYDAGNYRTIEVADLKIVGLPKKGNHYTVLGEAPTRQEADVIATILRIMAPT